MSWTDSLFIETDIQCVCQKSKRYLMNTCLLCPLCGNYTILNAKVTEIIKAKHGNQR